DGDRQGVCIPGGAGGRVGPEAHAVAADRRAEGVAAEREGHLVGVAAGSGDGGPGGVAAADGDRHVIDVAAARSGAGGVAAADGDGQVACGPPADVHGAGCVASPADGDREVVVRAV